jgi:hypothetical protein
MMLHTFIGADDDEVKDIVREPMIGYLGSSVGLIKQFASTFPAFKNLPQGDDPNELLASLSKSEMRELLEVAFERYYETSGLFGTPARAAEMVARLKEAGVDEVACLVDFGVPSQQVFEGLERLAEFKDALGGSPESGDERLSAGDLIRKHRVTHLQCTPSMASMFVADPETRSAFASLEVLMVGGEALPGDLATSLVNVTGGRVLNMYGPTETTIWSTTSPVTGADPACPIGTPIANTSIYILDAEQRLLPPGMVGELWIGGEGVTRGYLERPELTAERFLPDPFGHATGGRMYRTGDLARIRPDGVVDFLGRVDQQVKVRGYRIEPGEIESVMRSLPGIVEAVVIAREDEPGDHRLVGYYVSATGEDGDTGSLRAALGAQLPEYMVPTNFVRLDRLPLTPNAKIDRKALPAPSAKTAPLASRKAAPETPPVEPNHVDASPEAVNLVASTWEQVLRAEALPRDRSFFDLGGNSLLLLQVHRRLHEHHPDLRLTELFKYPTISSLALHLSHNRPSTTQRDDGMSRASARRAALGRRLTNA